MTYKEKFAASQDRALSQIIATKILRDLTQLRSTVDNSETVPRRWIWELIQNAKDVHSLPGVKIKIEANVDNENPYIKFSHNGQPFTADNIRFLIEQISTKDRKKDEQGKRKTTGKFGTGFLTTHLLSHKVIVEGIAKEPDLDYRKFQVELDRSGYELEDITDAVYTAKKSIEDLDTRQTYHEYVEGEFNTIFTYPLEDNVSIKVAKHGIQDLENCLLYTLVFVDEIISVEIQTNKVLFRDNSKTININDHFQFITIVEVENSKEKFHTVAKITKDYTSIVVPISVENGHVKILEISEDIPRLFCDFPIVGAEKFPFPVIVNNPHFNPTDARDGIFLTNAGRTDPNSEENKAFLKDAVDLFLELLNYASINNWSNLFELAHIYKIDNSIYWVDENWFKNAILFPIRGHISTAKIITNADGNLQPMIYEGKPYSLFPIAAKKEIREKIWSFAKYWLSNCIPAQTEIEIWNRIIWEECGKLNVTNFASFIENTKSIEELSTKVQGINIYDWLNGFYDLLKLEEKEYDSIINKKAIFPNQNGTFCLKGVLFKDVAIIDDFKDILLLLGKDIRATLIDQKIITEFGTEKIRDQQYIVREITTEVNEKANNREVSKNYTAAFKKLLLYFNSNPNKAEELFPTIYQNKHLLYNDEEVLKNFNKAEQLDDLMAEFSVSDISELREKLSKQKSNHNILPLTQELILSMGITSIDEWQKALEEKDFASLFSHKSVPTDDMFIFAQSHIARAKQRIIEYLNSLSNYDLSGMDETAKTILAGVIKDGKSISIVVRPAYGGEVIIYYGSERDILYYEDSELWVDDGKDIKEITLGHILKTAQIRKFPI